MEICEKDFNSLAVYAFRYALGRKTYAPSDVCEIVARQRTSLSPTTKLIMRREIVNEIDRDKGGMHCDVKEWTKLLDILF